MAVTRKIYAMLLIIFEWSSLFVPSSSMNSALSSTNFEANFPNNTNVMAVNYIIKDILPLIKAVRRVQNHPSENNNAQDNSNNRDFDIFNPVNYFMEDILLILDKSPCLNDTERLITGFFNNESWAIQFFDATGKPGPSLTEGWLNFVGNYDQCTSASAPSTLLPNGIRTRKFYGGYFQLALQSSQLPVLVQIGLCLPNTCSEKQIISFGKELVTAANLSFSIASVHHLTNATEVTSATICAIVIVCLIVLLMIVGTLFDVAFFQYAFWQKENRNKIEDTFHSRHTPITCDDQGAISSLQMTNKILCCNLDANNTDQPNSILTKILLAFSIYSNGKKLLNVSQAEGFLQSIHGIRFFGISWVALAHTYAFISDYALNRADGLTKFLNRWTFDLVSNSFMSVDTFFTLSGLLTSYLTIGQLLKKGWKINWSLFYFHRFWRLTPTYMLVILIYLGFQQYFIRGPLRNAEQPMDKSECEKNWWTNLLYINNIVKSREMCFRHSWYLSNDMQFFVLSPLMIIPYYFHRLAGVCSCLIFLFATWITTGVLSAVHELPPTSVNLKVQLRGGTFDYWLNDYYIKPWCRIGPFVVGIMAGYILAVHEGRPFYIKWWIVLIGWVTATASALAVLFGLQGDITGNDPSSIGAAALYNAVSRSVWGACVGWVIIACTAGYGGPVNALLSWSPFVVLGRLSYMVYLIHVPIIFIFYQNLDQLAYVNDTWMVINYVGMLVVSNLIAFALVLGLESPMIGLEKAILKRRSAP